MACSTVLGSCAMRFLGVFRPKIPRLAILEARWFRVNGPAVPLCSIVAYQRGATRRAARRLDGSFPE